jgi:hypothetical protein
MKVSGSGTAFITYAAILAVIVAFGLYEAGNNTGTAGAPAAQTTNKPRSNY